MNGSDPFGPWNPGIESPVPHRLRHLCTIFRPENSYTSYEEARELRGLTGLDYTDLTAFRPERLALHELLVRVSADFSVPDGEKVEDLGINFRSIVREILAGYVEPRCDAVAAAYRGARGESAGIVEAELDALYASPRAPEAIARWETRAHSQKPSRRSSRSTAGCG